MSTATRAHLYRPHEFARLLRGSLDCSPRPGIEPRPHQIRLHDIDIVHELPHPKSPPQPLNPWTYQNADALVASCPLDSEIQQIRADFNIYFDKGLIDHGVLVPWSCSVGGSESSIMLSMYNTFRLLKCIPFDTTFPWDSAHSNLYDWLQSLSLSAIGFIWADDPSTQRNYATHGRVYLLGNFLAQRTYRKWLLAEWSG